MAKKKSAVKKLTKAKTSKKATNSLVANINRRKKAGISRKKKDSTIAPEAYSEMEKGWPAKSRRKKA